jgi:Tol biopolymer transport system component
MRREQCWGSEGKEAAVADHLVERLWRRRGLRVWIVAMLAFLFSFVVLDTRGFGLWESYEAGEEVSFETADFAPDWSPDGSLVAFESNRRGGGVYVIDSSGQGLRRLLRGEASDAEWSPDGRRLAFVGRDGVYVVSATGGRAIRIVRGKEFSLPAWSPDGHTLAIVKGEPDFSSAIYTVGLDGQRLKRLLPRYRGAVGEARPGSPGALSETDPAWSPDGRSIAFQAGDGQLVTARIADGRRRVIASEGAYEPAWSPDGRLIAYQNQGELFVTNADGSGHARRLAPDAGHPSWAPDSHRLVFEHYLYNNQVWGAHPSSLSIVDVADGEIHKLTFGPTVPTPSSM